MIRSLDSNLEEPEKATQESKSDDLAEVDENT